MSLAHYAGIFDHRRLALLSRAVPDDHRLGVAATWAMSLDQIAARAPAAAALLDLCAALGPADVPLALLSGASVVLDGPLARVVADELALEDAIAELLRFSLVARHGSGLSLHPLLRAVLRERPASEAAGAARLRVDPDPAGVHARRPGAGCRLAALVVVGTARAGRRRAPRRGGGARPGGPATVRRGPLPAGTGDLPAARDAAERALDGALRAGERGEVQAASLAALTSHLGLVLEHLGDLPAARGHQERALKLLRAAGGTGTALEATVLVRLGGVLSCSATSCRPWRVRAGAVGARPDRRRAGGGPLPHRPRPRPLDGGAAQARAHHLRPGGRDPRTLRRRPASRHGARALGQAVVLQDLGDVEGAYALQSSVVTTLVETFGERRARTSRTPWTSWRTWTG